MNGWTGHWLVILANYAQALSAITLVGAAVALYHAHRCHHCRRLARYRVGSHMVPVCRRHRVKEERATRRPPSHWHNRGS